MLNLGRIDDQAFTQGSGAGGNTTVTIPVPDGQIWVVRFIESHHDDGGGNRTYTVTVSDGTTTISWTNGTTYAANNTRSILLDMGWATDMVLTPGCQITITWNALAAATTAYANIHIEKYAGMFGYALEV